MNPKIEKLRVELEKTRAKANEYLSRCKEIERQITSLENNDILALVHRHNLDIEQLSVLIKNMKDAPADTMRESAKEGYDQHD